MSGYLAHCEISPIEKWTKGTNCNSWPSGFKFHPSEKAKAIADCLYNQFTPHDLFDENYERRAEARVQALL
jgi:hypothetical protein